MHPIEDQNQPLEVILHEALKARGILPPETEEELAKFIQKLDEDETEIDVPTPEEILKKNIPERTSKTIIFNSSHSKTDDKYRNEFIGMAARKGGAGIPNDIWEQMQKDKKQQATNNEPFE